MTVLHVVFSEYGANNLTNAIELARRSDRVIAFRDDLSFGPINPPDIGARAEWIKDNLGCSEWYDAADEADFQKFWKDSTSSSFPRVVWVSRRSVREFAGFLEWLSRNPDNDFQIVDLNSAEGGGELSEWPLPLIEAEDIHRHRLWDAARPLSRAEQADLRLAWSILREENAPLRILTQDLRLVSASLDCFDEQLLACAEERWTEAAAYVLGRLLAEQLWERIFQTSDRILASRLLPLSRSGKLEVKGDPFRLKSCRVRRKRAPAH